MLGFVTACTEKVPALQICDLAYCLALSLSGWPIPVIHHPSNYLAVPLLVLGFGLRQPERSVADQNTFFFPFLSFPFPRTSLAQKPQYHSIVIQNPFTSSLSLLHDISHLFVFFVYYRPPLFSSVTTYVHAQLEHHIITTTTINLRIPRQTLPPPPHVPDSSPQVSPKIHFVPVLRSTHNKILIATSTTFYSGTPFQPLRPDFASLFVTPSFRRTSAPIILTHVLRRGFYLPSLDT